jgi:hypothetical protein
MEPDKNLAECVALFHAFLPVDSASFFIVAAF